MPILHFSKCDLYKPLYGTVGMVAKGAAEQTMGCLAQRGFWRSVLLFSVAALLAFLANLSFAIWAMVNIELREGVGVLAERSCNETKKLNAGIHVLINALSTLLLAGSNYCMQCLLAPTRASDSGLLDPPESDCMEPSELPSETPEMTLLDLPTRRLLCPLMQSSYKGTPNRGRGTTWPVPVKASAARKALLSLCCPVSPSDLEALDGTIFNLEDFFSIRGLLCDCYTQRLLDQICI